MRAVKRHIKSISAIALFILVSFTPLFISSPQAADSPVYTWIDSIQENLAAPTSLAIDSYERIYVAESIYNRVKIYSSGGKHLNTINGLTRPIAVNVDVNGRILIANEVDKNVEVYDSQFNSLFKLGAGDGEFKKPCAIDTVSSGNIYVADCNDNKIKIYNPDGTFQFSFGVTGNYNGQFHFPSSIVVDEAAGEIIVSDIKNQSGMLGSYQMPRVQIFDMNGNFLRTFGIRGVGIGRLFSISALTVDSSSRIYIADSYQNVVQVFDNAGASLGVVYELSNPVVTPTGITIGNGNKLLVASLNTAKVETYGIDSYVHMVVSPDSLAFQEDEGSTNTSLLDLQVMNGGTAGFDWTVIPSDPWITLSHETGTLNMSEMATISVGVDVTGLAVGNYNGTIEIHSSSGAYETVDVTLSVQAAPLPEMTVTPQSLSFVTINGSGMAPQQISIGNIGGGTLNWTASESISWLQLDKTSGTAPDAISVTADAAGVTEGIYNETITIDGGNAAGSPVDVQVQLTIIIEEGSINVNTNIAQATFTISGPASYSGSGTTWSATGAPIGGYIIVYGDVPGYTTPPSESATLNDNGVINFSGQYTQIVGSISVTTNRSDSQFTVSGPVTYNGSGTNWSVTDAPVGTYTVTFGDINGYYTPGSDTQALTVDGSIAFAGDYYTANRNIIAGAGYDPNGDGFVLTTDNVGNPTGYSFNAHDYTYGVNVAAGDVDGDGFDEVITAPGPGETNPSEIRVYDRYGSELTGLNINSTNTYYGVNVASADINGDGYYEIITGTGVGRDNPAIVRVFLYNPQTQGYLDSGLYLRPYGTKTKGQYGVKVAAGDVDGDGFPEIITVAGSGSNDAGIVKIWQIDTSSGVGHWNAFMLKEFMADSNQKDSVNLASGDVNGDGLDEIIAGAGPDLNDTGTVTVYDQDGLILSQFNSQVSASQGAAVAAGDIDNDGIAEIIAASSPDNGNQAQVKMFDINGTLSGVFYPFNRQSGATVAVGYFGME